MCAGVCVYVRMCVCSCVCVSLSYEGVVYYLLFKLARLGIFVLVCMCELKRATLWLVRFLIMAFTRFMTTWVCDL